MKRHLSLALLIVLACITVSCASLGNRSIGKSIVGHYEYVHSWDYASPDKVGTMHCDEVGRLDFNADGTFVDVAVQNHIHCLPDSTRRHYAMDYYCEGQWKVQEEKFLFCEHSENFMLKLIDTGATLEDREFADKLSLQNTPVSSRWFTFDIDRLDGEWFVWSYTDKRGNKTTWEMKRSQNPTVK